MKTIRVFWGFRVGGLGNFWVGFIGVWSCFLGFLSCFLVIPWEFRSFLFRPLVAPSKAQKWISAAVFGGHKRTFYQTLAVFSHRFFECQIIPSRSLGEKTKWFCNIFQMRKKICVVQRFCLFLMFGSATPFFAQFAPSFGTAGGMFHGAGKRNLVFGSLALTQKSSGCG